MKLYSSKEERDFIISLAVRSWWSGKPIVSEIIASIAKVLVLVEGRTAVLADLDDLALRATEGVYSMLVEFYLDRDESGQIRGVVCRSQWETAVQIQRDVWVSFTRRAFVAACAAQAELAA